MTVLTVRICYHGTQHPSFCFLFWFSLALLIHWAKANVLQKKNTEALVVSSKEIGLVVNYDKTKYMVMSRDQNAGRSHSIKTENNSFQMVEEFAYLGTAITNQNSIPEEIKSRLKSGNACYHLVQNLLSSSALLKNLNIKIYRIIILPVVLYGCET